MCFHFFSGTSPHFTPKNVLKAQDKNYKRQKTGQFFHLCKLKFDTLSWRCVKSAIIFSGQRWDPKAISQLLGSIHISEKSVVWKGPQPAGNELKMQQAHPALYISHSFYPFNLPNSQNCSGASTVILHLNQAIRKSRLMGSIINKSWDYSTNLKIKIAFYQEKLTLTTEGNLVRKGPSVQY